MSETNAQSTVQQEMEASASTEFNGQLAAHVDRSLNILKHVFIVGGEKGGVGKTWFTYILIELLLQLDRDPTILDLDKTTPNVAKAYLKEIYQQWSSTNVQTLRVFETIERTEGGQLDALVRLKKLLSEQIVLSNNPDDTKSRDRLSEVVELSDNTIISLPSQSQSGLCYWLDETDLALMAATTQIVLFWVSDGSYESLSLLENFMYKYPELQYCLVVNKGIGSSSEWENYRLGLVNPDLNQMIANKELKAVVIDKVVLSEELSIRLQKENLTFSEILTDPDINQRVAYRLKTWLGRSFTTIKNTGYF
jgi:cellulose biosynthesis protein BcsQ